MHILLVGLGNMGSKYLKKLRELNLKPVVCDTDLRKSELCKDCPFYRNIEDVKEEISHAIVAVNPENHVKVAKELLDRGIPVLLEKPPALSSEEFLKIANNPLLEISEIELYSEVVKSFPSQINPKEIFIERLNKGSGYINPLWDLAWHDFYILQYLFGDIKLENVSKNELIWEVKGKVKGEIPFTLKVAWNYPDEQVRRWTVKTDKGDIVMDFQREEITYGDFKKQRIYGDKLREMVQDFVEGIRREGSRERALKNLRLLENLQID
ncbi:MAG: gfo/Idh/MocA family oxidoreductase [Aquifex sp.]|nr:MAG: gfo/Idh/MocA family oxidoreductase [Aquifex sp.]